MPKQDRTDLTLAQQVAQHFADFIAPCELPSRVRSAPVDVMVTAAAHVARNWGEYGYTLAVEDGSFGWNLFRGHSSDGSDFWFVVDRYCNIADVKS